MYKYALAATSLFMASSPLLAQPEGQRPPTGESVFDGDYVTLGAGVAVGPSYDGSDDYVVSPLPVILGSVAGIDFEPRGPGVALDVIPYKSGAKVDFIFGPVGRARFDRNNSIKDDVVRSLGELDVAIELGAVGGVQVNRLLNPFDSLTAEVDFRWDVAGAHRGTVISPSLTYFTPINRVPRSALRSVLIMLMTIMLTIISAFRLKEQRPAVCRASAPLVAGKMSVSLRSAPLISMAMQPMAVLR